MPSLETLSPPPIRKPPSVLSLAFPRLFFQHEQPEYEEIKPLASLPVKGVFCKGSNGSSNGRH